MTSTVAYEAYFKFDLLLANTWIKADRSYQLSDYAAYLHNPVIGQI